LWPNSRTELGEDSAHDCITPHQGQREAIYLQLQSSPMIRVRVKQAEDQPWIEALLQERWGGTVVITHGTRFDAARLPALVAGDREGLATYQKRDRVTAELITLDVRSPHQGVGTALIEALSALLTGEGVRRLFVTTTNDNLEALRFYQRRGFRFAALRQTTTAGSHFSGWNTRMHTHTERCILCGGPEGDTVIHVKLTKDAAGRSGPV
jgi:GNAT superfamily N-acetyltransferase